MLIFPGISQPYKYKPKIRGNVSIAIVKFPFSENKPFRPICPKVEMILIISLFQTHGFFSLKSVTAQSPIIWSGQFGVLDKHFVWEIQTDVCVFS